MRTRAIAVLAVGVTAAALMSGCSSSSSKSSSGGGGKSGSSSSSNSGSGGSSGKKEIGVILPDTTSSTRYTQIDAPLFTKAFKAAGIGADIQNAGGDKTKFASIAQSMISEGVKVLIIDSIDIPSGIAVEAQAKQAGVKVIDYDRVNLGGSADYYVSFDNEKIGELQGQSMLNCLTQFKSPKPAKIIEMDGGTDVDNNAVLFKQGVQKVFKANPSKVKVVSDVVVKGWDISTAAPAFQQALTAAGGSIDGVYGANDDIANAVIGVLKGKGLNGKIPVTGQDSNAEGLRNVLTGQQCAGIYKSYALEAGNTAKLAVALAKGQSASSAGVKLTGFKDPKGNRTIQALLLPAHILTKSTIKDVIATGQVTASAVCAGLTAQCKAAGITP